MDASTAYFNVVCCFLNQIFSVSQTVMAGHGTSFMASNLYIILI